MFSRENWFRSFRSFLNSPDTCISSTRRPSTNSWLNEGQTGRLSAIAQHAGVSHGLLIHYFASYEGLVESALSDQFKEVRSTLRRRVLLASGQRVETGFSKRFGNREWRGHWHHTWVHNTCDWKAGLAELLDDPAKLSGFELHDRSRTSLRALLDSDAPPLSVSVELRNINGVPGPIFDVPVADLTEFLVRARSANNRGATVYPVPESELDDYFARLDAEPPEPTVPSRRHNQIPKKQKPLPPMEPLPDVDPGRLPENWSADSQPSPDMYNPRAPTGTGQHRRANFLQGVRDNLGMDEVRRRLSLLAAESSPYGDLNALQVDTFLRDGSLAAILQRQLGRSPTGGPEFDLVVPLGDVTNLPARAIPVSPEALADAIEGNTPALLIEIARAVARTPPPPGARNDWASISKVYFPHASGASQPVYHPADIPVLARLAEWARPAPARRAGTPLARTDFQYSEDFAADALSEAQAVRNALDAAVEGKISILRTVDHGHSIEFQIAVNNDAGALIGLRLPPRGEPYTDEEVRRFAAQQIRALLPRLDDTITRLGGPPQVAPLRSLDEQIQLLEDSLDDASREVLQRLRSGDVDAVEVTHFSRNSNIGPSLTMNRAEFEEWWSAIAATPELGQVDIRLLE